MSCKRKRKKSPPSSGPSSGGCRKFDFDTIEDIGQLESDPKKYRLITDRRLKILLISEHQPKKSGKQVQPSSITRPLDLQSISLDYTSQADHDCDYGLEEWKEVELSKEEQKEVTILNTNKTRRRGRRNTPLTTTTSSLLNVNSQQIEEELNVPSPELYDNIRDSDNDDDSAERSKRSKKTYCTDNKSKVKSSDRNGNGDNTDEDGTCAVAVLVATGYLDEPSQYHGIAHLHEHLLTLTLENHIGEMTLMHKIREFGGEDSNITERTCTHHSFAVAYSHLATILPIFVQLLQRRSFPVETIEKEVGVLEYEFRPITNLKGLIRDHIMTHAAKEGHPLNNFTWGNEASLGPPSNEAKDAKKVTKEEQDKARKTYFLELKAELEKFTAAYYVRGNMYVAFQSPLPLDDMQDLITSAFSSIPDWIPPHICRDPEPFKTKRFQKKRYHVRIPHAQELLYLTWALSIDDWQNSYKCKPIAYLANLIRSHQPHGLVEFLKKKKWIQKLDSGVQFDNRTRFGALFIVKMKITEEGAKNEDKIIAAVHSFLGLLAQTPMTSHERLWNEMKSYRRIWLEQNASFIDPFKNVEKLVKALRWHQNHPQHIIPAYTQFIEFDGKAVASVLAKLGQADKMNVMLLSRRHFQGGEVHNILWDTFYQVQFAFRDFDPAELTLWSDSRSNQKVFMNTNMSFQFPATNPFLTKDVYLTPNRLKELVQDKKSCKDTTQPLFIVDKKVWGELFCRLLDPKYPWLILELEITTKFDLLTPRRMALALLLRYAWQYELRAVCGSGKEVGISVTFQPSADGLSLHLQGFDKMSTALLIRIIRFIKIKVQEINDHGHTNHTFESVCHYDLAMEFYMKHFYDLNLHPENFARYTLELLQKSGQISHFDLLTELRMINRDEFKTFYMEFLSALQFDLIAEGSLLTREFQEILSELRSVPCTPLELWQKNPDPIENITKFPHNVHTIWRHTSNNPVDSTTFFLTYYQVGREDPLIPSLVKGMFRPFFHHVRYIHGAAYGLGVKDEVIEGPEGQSVMGVKFYVRSLCDKFSAERLYSIMDEFIKIFYEQLQRMSKSTFDRFLQTYGKGMSRRTGILTQEEMVSKFEDIFLPGGKHYARVTVVVEGHWGCTMEKWKKVRSRRNKPIPISQGSTSFPEVKINPCQYERGINICPIARPLTSASSSSCDIKFRYIESLQEFYKWSECYPRTQI